MVTVVGLVTPSQRSRDGSESLDKWIIHTAAIITVTMEQESNFLLIRREFSRPQTGRLIEVSEHQDTLVAGKGKIITCDLLFIQ